MGISPGWVVAHQKACASPVIWQLVLKCVKHIFECLCPLQKEGYEAKIRKPEKKKQTLSCVLFGGLVLVIALLTVGYQTVRAAIANPVDALKYE
ncbi:MAG: hypothetical protein O2954_18265 [bacterium]|nr:hypothetical protein [bacterium]